MYPVLELKRVSKLYKNRTAVNSMTFNLFPSEIFGLIGPNGAGKSTTLKMICGLTEITNGSIRVDGYDVKTNFVNAIKNVGAVIEVPQMYPYLSGRKNLEIYANFYGKEAKNRINQVLDMVGMRNRANDKFGTYSLGMKQRIGIAQALLNKPKLLILDEPTNGLDPNGVIEIRNLLKHLAKKEKMAIIVSSHNLSELEQICDSVAIINRGKLIDYKSMLEIQNMLDVEQKVCIKVDYPNFAGKIIYDTYGIDSDVLGSSIILSIEDKELTKIISLLLSKHLTVFRIEKINRSLEEFYLDVINHSQNSTSVF